MCVLSKGSQTTCPEGDLQCKQLKWRSASVVQVPVEQHSNQLKETESNVEDRWICWTLHKIHQCGLTTGSMTLLSWGLELATKITRKVHILHGEQLWMVGNFDETYLSLNGSNTNCNGTRTVSYPFLDSQWLCVCVCVCVGLRLRGGLL